MTLIAFSRSSRAVCAVCLFLILLFSKHSYSQTFGTPVQVLNPYPGAGGSVGTYSVMQVVNGNPAICFYDATRTALYYMRAADADGTAWNTPTSIDATGSVGQYISFQIVNGNPAVAYYDATNSTLKFARAADADGTIWGTPVTVDATSNVGQYTSLLVVNGNPAIAYRDVGNKTLKFVRATDANGAVWGLPQTLDNSADVGFFTSLQIVNGNPAISYFDFSAKDLKYIRAADVNGATWSAAVTVEGTGSVGYYASMQVVNGKPAIAYYETLGPKLKFVRATDADGATWGAGQTIDAGSSIGQYGYLQIVNGNPAISYNGGTAGTLKFARATDADGTVWGTPQAADATGGNLGTFTNMQIVNGNPAIAYYDIANTRLKYVRATNASGSAWYTPQSFDANAPEGQYTSLQIVNGNPAFAFYDNTDQDLKFVRAANAAGTSWNTQLLLDGAASNVGQYTSMQVVNGSPAISYYSQTSGDLIYIRATDASGAAWGTPMAIDGTSGSNVGQYTSLQVVNGNPAIAYYDVDNTNLKYVRATDANGATWGAAQTLDVTAGDIGQYASLQIVNGNPAISYYDVTNGSLKFIRASNANGTTWGSPVILSTGIAAQYTSLQIVNGYPAISYYDGTNAVLKFIRATDADGAAWGVPQTIDNTGSVGQYTSLQIVNGNPAISYYDVTNSDLKFVRASDASGIGWNTPQVLHTPDITGQYTSMVPLGTGAAISFYSASMGLPYFVATTVSLPVTLTHIGAQWKNTTVQINWQVADESNINRYVVERSADGKTFSKLSAVTAANEAHSHSYNYIDARPLDGTNYYRLRIEEATGTVRYSTIVNLGANNGTSRQLSVYPNPVRNNALQFEVTVPAGTYRLKVVNSAGMEAMSTVYKHAGGTVAQVIPVPLQMTDGVYHLVISNKELRMTASFLK